MWNAASRMAGCEIYPLLHREEVVSFIVDDDDERWKILDLDFPDRFHPQVSYSMTSGGEGHDGRGPRLDHGVFGVAHAVSRKGISQLAIRPAAFHIGQPTVHSCQPTGLRFSRLLNVKCRLSDVECS